MFLDTFEVYSIHLGERFEHSLYSGTVFYAFRIAFDALAFLIGYMLWKRIWLRRFFSDYPRDERDVSGVMSWITARCGDKNRWPRRYHDELMFLVICKAFVNGEEEFVRQLTGYLPRLQVESKVRELFRGADGTALFQSSNQ